MARHRLMPHAKQPAPVCRSYTALVVWPLHHLGLAAGCQRAIRAARTPALSVAVVAPVVLAGAVGAAAPQIHTPTTALRGTAISPVSAVTAAGSGPSGPAVVTVAHTSTSFHIAAAAVSAPPPIIVNPPGALGIPMIALSAYRSAEQKMAVEVPGCGVSWNLLAGIGRIESGHAGGGAVDARGTAVTPIYGPSLDGTLPGNEVIISSSAGNRLTYARAMGPMQFLPGTWVRYASDGKGDGTADPQNLFDATLAASRYLCSGGLNLRDPAQVMAAILRYNNSTPYAQNVLGWAAAYATGVVPVDLPAITGPPPPLGNAHDEHPEGLGPGLPMNVNGLPVDDPLARTPLIDFGPPQVVGQPPIWPSQSPTPGGPSCTLICIGRQAPLPPQQPPWALPPPDATPSPPRQTVPPQPSTSPSSAAVSPAGPVASPAANTPAAQGPTPGTAG